MANRPRIPAEVERNLLVESGHRCAVCGESAGLEFAHIVPWSKTHSHNPANLICLCATCHARTDSEQWGAAALRLYKEAPWVSRRVLSARPATVIGTEGDAIAVHALRRYREWVVRQCVQIDLGDLGTPADAGRCGGRINLARIYVDVDTTRQAEKRQPKAGQKQPCLPASDGSEPLSALGAVQKYRRLALLGLPGAGKTTFIRHMSLHLAARPLPKNRGVLKDLGLELSRLPGWPAGESDLVPITVTLRRFAATFAPKGLSKDGPETQTVVPSQVGHTAHLWEFIQSTLREEKLGDAAEPLREALQAGRAIVFFDGLDEVPDDEQKQFVREAVEDFSNSPFAPSRMLLTCRTFSYRNQNWMVPGFADTELKELNEDQISNFISAWFKVLSDDGVMTAEQARIKSESLWPAIKGRGLRELAGNPLQLTSMAVLHRVEALPDSRALLYDQLVDLLLLEWDKARFDKDKIGVPLLALREEAQCRKDEFVDGLAWLAWQIHDPKRGGQPGIPADISKLELRGALERLHPSPDDTEAGQIKKAEWAVRVLAVFSRRGALLREETRDIFRFPHRSYQEFLAGRHLAQQPDFAKQAASYVDDSRHWWEVVRWAANYMAYVKRSIPNSLALVGELNNAVAADQTSPIAWRKVWLAGDILAEIGVNQVRRVAGLGESCLTETRQLLTQAVAKPEEILSAKERAQVGIALGKLYDERKGVALRSDGLPDLAFDTELPAGQFTLTGRKKGHRIEKKYQISRYPVTVMQFQAFVESGGYDGKNPEAPKWWGKEGWKWKRAENVTGPKDFEPVFQTPNHPRVGVSWFEAAAFCCWLSGKLDLEIRLPHETEWEQAARWNAKTRQADDRRFPWGGSVDEDRGLRCNCGAAGIDHTSAVGLFPNGNAECGAADMSGNVWEWCSDCLGTKSKRSRVLRGGAWISGSSEGLACEYRGSSELDKRLQYVGFRCVLVLGDWA